MYNIDTWLCCASMKASFWWLSLVTSGMWPFSFVFVEPLVAQHLSHWGILALMELPRWLNICVDVGIPSFGCALRFNPWYKNFISGLRSCENQPPCSWLIIKLRSLLWEKIVSGLTGNLFVAYSILLSCSVLFHAHIRSCTMSLTTLILCRIVLKCMI